jgi:hypothetical protein
MNAESKAITHVLELYRDSLKAADSRAAAGLFAAIATSRRGGARGKTVIRM